MYLYRSEFHLGDKILREATIEAGFPLNNRKFQSNAIFIIGMCQIFVQNCSHLHLHGIVVKFFKLQILGRLWYTEKRRG